MALEILERTAEKTGRDLQGWIRLLAASGTNTRKERVEWLMTAQGLGRVAANAIASHAEGKAINYEDQDGLLAAMYAGPKGALKPIYHQLLEVAQSFGSEFSFYHCAGQTTFKRSRQFAWVKPATKTRIDLGLALPGVQPAGRLLAVAGTNDKDRVRVRYALASLVDIDEEIERALRRAWDADETRRR